MKLAHRSGTTIAAAAAALLLAGAALAPAAQAEAAKGQCIGANSCKGQGACKDRQQLLQGSEFVQRQGLPFADQVGMREDPRHEV